MNFEKDKNKDDNGVCNVDREKRIIYALKSEDDFHQGKVYSPEEAVEELTKRLKSKI